MRANKRKLYIVNLIKRQISSLLEVPNLGCFFEKSQIKKNLKTGTSQNHFYKFLNKNMITELFEIIFFLSLFKSAPHKTTNVIDLFPEPMDYRKFWNNFLYEHKQLLLQSNNFLSNSLIEFRASYSSIDAA